MKHPRIWAAIIALLAPPLVGKPVYHAIVGDVQKAASIETVEAATPAAQTMATAQIRMPALAMAPPIPTAAITSGPNADDIKRCRQVLSKVDMPKRQSITDDMEPKQTAAINTANARMLAGRKCLDGLLR